jgi:hypothetical protein
MTPAATSSASTTATCTHHGIQAGRRPVAANSDTSAPTMNTSPCAKLINCSTPYTIVYPTAISA